jgi:hypothetical protein
MTLKEKLFNAIFDNAWEFKTENVIPQCEVIADEFAIGFANWIRVCKLKGRPYDFENIKELLIIYKEEKEL